MRRWVLLAVVLLLPTAALADPKDDARRRFQQGVELARGGDLRGALEQFKEADQIFQHPATTYNIAFAYQQLGEYEDSLAWYRTLRELAPERADQVDAVIAELEAKLAAQRQAEVAPVSGGGGGLAADEIQRLRTIAAELEALAEKVGERPAVDPQGSTVGTDPSEEGDPTDPASDPGDPASAGATSGFEGDAYERVVVTASRYGQDPLDSPSTISILTADDVRLSGATDITDLLRRVVGVDVMSMAAGQPEISIRGFNRELNNKVLVLIDGRSVYWDFIGTTQWDSFPIVLEEIERIEVIRGPGSAVYGANAVTGVVNIITKTPGETAETIASLSVGSPGYLRGAAMTSGRSGETAYRLSAGYRQHGRWAKIRDVDDGSALVPFLENQDRGSESVRAHGRIDRRLGDESFVSLSGGYVDGSAEIYNIGALGDFARQTVNTYVRADGTFGPVHARVFWNRVAGQAGPWLATPRDAQILNADFVAQTFDAELEAFGAFETGPVEHRVNGGVGYRRKAIDDFQYLDSNDIDEDHFNVFINEEASVGPVRVVGSLRADRHPLISLDKTVSPRLAAIVRVDDERAVRVSGGTAFRVPTLVESYMDTVIPTDVDGVVIRDVGSRELVPERIITVEGGYHDESTLYHQADVAVYYNRVSQLIGLSPVSPVVEGLDPSGAWVAGETGWVNLADVYHGVGIEAEGEVYPTDGLDVFANVAAQVLLRQSPGEDGLIQDKTPSLIKANAGVQYRSPYQVDLSAAAHVVSAQSWTLRQFDDSGQVENVTAPIPLRVLATARVAVRPFPDEELELAMVGWNLTGFIERSREHPQGQQLQPRVFGSVSYRF